MICRNQTEKYHCNKQAVNNGFCSSECEHAFKQLQYHSWLKETQK
jgi:hypothetical protein